jgi:hypothetical protein
MYHNYNQFRVWLEMSIVLNKKSLLMQQTPEKSLAQSVSLRAIATLAPDAVPQGGFALPVKSLLV